MSAVSMALQLRLVACLRVIESGKISSALWSSGSGKDFTTFSLTEPCDVGICGTGRPA